MTTVRPVGPGAVLVELGSLAAVHRLYDEVRRSVHDGLDELVPAYRTVLAVGSDAALAEVRRLASRVDGRPDAAGPRGDARIVEVPVVYDGVDLDDVARLTGLSVAEVVARHTAAVYDVAFLGFAPGFPYLTGLDPALVVPRLAAPRPSVPAGSVAVAATQAGIYPRPSPGGWRLLGRTSLVLFDSSRDPPATLAPGDRVRFVAVAP